MGRDVIRAKRALYLKILERGVMGIDNEALYAEKEEEDYKRSVVMAALKGLLKSGHILSESDKTSLQIKDILGAKAMTITIGKILPQVAVAWIDDE